MPTRRAVQGRPPRLRLRAVSRRGLTGGSGVRGASEEPRSGGSRRAAAGSAAALCGGAVAEGVAGRWTRAVLVQAGLDALQPRRAIAPYL